MKGEWYLSPCIKIFIWQNLNLIKWKFTTLVNPRCKNVVGFMSGAEGHDLDVEVMPKGSQLLDGIAGKV